MLKRAHSNSLAANPRAEPTPTATDLSFDQQSDPLFPIQFDTVSVERRGRTLLDNVDLTLNAAGISVILGPNGAGKSVFLRVLHGLIAPSSGQLLFANAPATSDATARQALVFQRPVLLRRSAADNIAFVLRDLARPDRDQRVATILETARLSHVAQTPARKLSGGEQQRLAIARAIATEPQLLLLDEPSANLDPAATAAIEELIVAIAADGVKIVLVTHDLGQARRLADDVAFFADGRVDTHTAARTFFASPPTASARAFLQGTLPLAGHIAT